jgi:hypothetical protein
VTHIPGSREVEQALRSVERAVKSSLKEVNQHAAKLLARGDYPGAEAMVGIGRSVGDFGRDVEKMRQRWRSIRVDPEGLGGDSTDTTPLWEYYRPILRTLDSLGGDANRREIEQHVESELVSMLKSGDRRPMARGNPRWKIMVRRARKYLIREGFLEDGAGKQWRITETGRRAAHGETPAILNRNKSG